MFLTNKIMWISEISTFYSSEVIPCTLVALASLFFLINLYVVVLVQFSRKDLHLNIYFKGVNTWIIPKRQWTKSNLPLSEFKNGENSRWALIYFLGNL